RVAPRPGLPFRRMARIATCSRRTSATSSRPGNGIAKCRRYCRVGPGLARLNGFGQFTNRAVTNKRRLRPVLIGLWARHEAKSNKLRAVLVFQRLLAQQRGALVLSAHLQIDAILAGILVVLAARDFSLRTLMEVTEKLEMQECRQNRR